MFQAKKNKNFSKFKPIVQYSQQNYANNKILFYVWFEAMNTRIDLAICAEADAENLEEIATEIKAEIQKYEEIANRFSPESELSFVNENGFTGKTMVISPELYEILADCQVYNQKTLGYFDISINSFSRYKKNAKAYILDSKNSAVQLSHPDVQLDLSGFIKGYALAKVSQLLEKKGIENALINIGNSSVLAKGNHPFGNGWKISVPATGNEYVLQNECLTTSGNTDVTKYPVINPKTGEIDRSKSSVSVITTCPTIGEVLSTVAYIAADNELDELLMAFEGKLQGRRIKSFKS